MLQYSTLQYLSKCPGPALKWLNLYQKGQTHHHVEIHIETQCNIETLSEKVQFIDPIISYKLRNNNQRFQRLHFYKSTAGCLK